MHGTGQGGGRKGKRLRGRRYAERRQLRRSLVRERACDSAPVEVALSPDCQGTILATQQQQQRQQETVMSACDSAPVEPTVPLDCQGTILANQQQQQEPVGDVDVLEVPDEFVELEYFNLIPGGPTQLIKLHGALEGRPAVFLVDSGATGCYVSTAFMERHGLHGRHGACGTVRLADGTCKRYSAQLQRAEICIGDYIDNMWDFTVLDLSGFDAVLGKAWLDRFNPLPDWPRNSLQFVHHGKPIILIGAKSSATPVATILSAEECYAAL